MKASFKVALAIAGVCLAGRAQAQTVVVGPQAGSMALLPGAQVTVPIVADLTGSGGASLGSATIRLLWHPGVLAFRGVSGGAMGQPVVNADSAGGSLRVAVANPAGVTGQPVLLSATFAVIGAPGASDTLRLQLQELTRAVIFTDLLPSAVATAAHVCVSTGLWGDLDDNGAINGADALAILTNAVGLPVLPPFSIVNGDVDGDGQINTRDALIVLTYAVALPVNGFRVSAMNPGGCSVQAAASVQIQPKNAEVAVGDQFPLVATVRDSGGAAVQGVNLVWTSADTSIVKADGTGHLVGSKPGTGWVFAFAAPGLKDSAAVKVDSLRHVWWVNPAVAALNSGVELGSTTRPFSSIGQALARAAAADSVMIAPATYGEAVRLTKALTLVGDSTAAGRTVIHNATGPAVSVDSLPSGSVRLDRLWLEDSFGGVVAQSSGTGVVALRRITVARSRSVGISVRRVGQALFDHVQVLGAIVRGIELDTVPVVRLHAVTVDLVAPDGATGREVHAVRVATADSVAADSLVLATAGFRLDSARVAWFDGFTVRPGADPALWAIVGRAFALDHGDVSGVSAVGGVPWDTLPVAVGVQLGGGTATARVANTTLHDNGRPALGLSGADSVLLSRVSVADSRIWSSPGQWIVSVVASRRVAIQYSAFSAVSQNEMTFDGSDQTGQVTVDSSAFHGVALRAANIGFLSASRSAFDHLAEPALQAEQVGGVTLTADTIATTGGPAVRVVGGQRLAVLQSQITGSDTTLFVVDSTAVVDLHNLEVSGASGMFGDSTGGSFAVHVLHADSVALDSVWVHDNAASAIAVDTARIILLRWSLIENNHLSLPPTYLSKAVRLGGFRRVRITQSVVDLGAAAAALDGAYLQGVAANLGPLGRARIQVDSSTFLGGRALTVFGTSRLLHDTLSMFGLQAAPAMTSRTRGVYAQNVGFVEAKGIQVDSSSWVGTGLYANYIGGFDVQNSRFTHTGGAVGLYADTLYVGAAPTNPGPGVFSSNTVECDSAVSAVQYVVSLSFVAPVTVTNNVLQGHCYLGIVATNSALGAPVGSATMTDNFVSSSSSGPPFVTGGTMLSLQGRYLNALVARNTTAPGVLLISQGSAASIDSTRIENNIIHGNWRGGIFLTGTQRATTLRGNVVDSVPTNANYAAIYMGFGAAGTTTGVVGNRISRALKDGILLPVTDTTLLDSNVVVDSRTGVVFTNSKVVGHWNFIARDSVGLSGAANSFVQMASSVIKQSIKGWGARNTGTIPWDLTNNFWGDPLGPRCLSLCNLASAGDSIIGSVTALSYTQFLTSAPGNVPTGAPPALRVAPPLASRVGAPFVSAGATRAVSPTGRSRRSRLRPIGRGFAPVSMTDPLPLPRLPEVIR